jgi:hypothetical protein
MIKEIVIEDNNWIEVKDLVAKGRTNFKNINEVVQNLLKRHDSKEINFKAYELNTPRRQRKIQLDRDSVTVYENIEKGSKAYIVNGLLRFFIEEIEN